jgi:YfiH family protein
MIPFSCSPRLLINGAQDYLWEPSWSGSSVLHGFFGQYLSWGSQDITKTTDQSRILGTLSGCYFQQDTPESILENRYKIFKTLLGKDPGPLYDPLCRPFCPNPYQSAKQPCPSVPHYWGNIDPLSQNSFSSKSVNNPINPFYFAPLRQHHSNTVHTITGSFPWEKYTFQHPLMGDGLVTNVPKVVLPIVTADCSPILLWDPHHNVVGAAHSGWRGAQKGIIEATILRMLDLGADCQSIQALVGPTIGWQSYQVSPSFYDDFLKNPGLKGENALGALDTCFRFHKDGKLFFDLSRYVGLQLAQYLEKITFLNPDTFKTPYHKAMADPSSRSTTQEVLAHQPSYKVIKNLDEYFFFSYRRSSKGRNLSIICLM